MTQRKYNLYVYAIDQAEVVDKRQSSMAIVQIKLTGSLSEQRSQDSQQASNEDVEIVKAVTQKATPTETRVS